ncbi:hypothetical protein Bpfe_031283 [Biomphalaria pfeifferi]|uniref:Uncharacterized protein n=1 Tax=Biomphalaria pfeifferi TaxID=112525 RepID=A0AAD8AMG7_BIOPF|nr:hypothetical protein Bpfe_031604 [Biomphalaria pfeifferi]KAK0039195.1 hypothetical protein Bpfe_031374 [Biomphalaria pfeifferi]KAK0039289.1 hypothetical protein Bpfe_031283 [Biomphalaria pfeifferi]
MPTQTPVARAGFLRDQLSSSPCRTELFPTYNTLNATNYGHRTCPRPQEQGEPTSYDLKCRSKLLGDSVRKSKHATHSRGSANTAVQSACVSLASC